ncbi:MAG: ATP-binding protein [Deltaproteobacteria bacterium]|nr:ATP-binding protein [Deltaproteobacteria bacterium]
MDRYLEAQILKDLQRKMVFVGGPRQVGKTTLAKKLVNKFNGAYLNWDIPKNRTVILKRELPAETFLVFDELHKYKKWRNYLKGIYDEYLNTKKILTTGSARLDYYRFGGDSLQGRYHYLRLHPFSVAELKGGREAFDRLMRFGGFPEPCLEGSRIEADRWSAEYRTRFLEDDLESLEDVEDISQLETLLLRLPELVGSPLSLNSLREDLDVSHRAISRWMKIFERLYHVFRISPFTGPRIRAVKKQQKHYHFDWNLVTDHGNRFENLVACHLLKWIHFEMDTKGQVWELRYFRDSDGREVDFVIMKDRRPVRFIECKLSDTSISSSLRYLKERYQTADAFQLVAETERDFVKEQVRVVPAYKFLERLI